MCGWLIGFIESSPLPPRPQTIRSIAVRDLVVQPSILAMTLLAGQRAVLARTALAPPSLGVDSTGMLSPCPDDALIQCVSSQDDRPACFLAPWEFDGDWTKPVWFQEVQILLKMRIFPVVIYVLRCRTRMLLMT